MGEGSVQDTPHPTAYVDLPAMPSPPFRAFTPVFDGLWGEGASTTTALAATHSMTAALDHLTSSAPTRRFRLADPSMILWLIMIAILVFLIASPMVRLVISSF